MCFGWNLKIGWLEGGGSALAAVIRTFFMFNKPVLYKGMFMESLIMALPILPGKTEAVKTMFRKVKEQKWADYEGVQKRQGIEKERDFLQITPQGDFLLIYIESKDIQKTFDTFTTSKDPFDLWYMDEMKKNTGVDFSQPSSEALPELLIAYK